MHGSLTKVMLLRDSSPFSTCYGPKDAHMTGRDLRSYVMVIITEAVHPQKQNKRKWKDWKALPLYQDQLTTSTNDLPPFVSCAPNSCPK